MGQLSSIDKIGTTNGLALSLWPPKRTDTSGGWHAQCRCRTERVTAEQQLRKLADLALEETHAVGS